MAVSHDSVNSGCLPAQRDLEKEVTGMICQHLTLADKVVLGCHLKQSQTLQNDLISAS